MLYVNASELGQILEDYDLILFKAEGVTVAGKRIKKCSQLQNK